jgi:hypothetical protein
MNNRTRTVLAFIAGAAVGAAVTYVLTSSKGNDAVDEFRRLADKLKNDLNEKLGKRRPGTGPAPVADPLKSEDILGV